MICIEIFVSPVCQRCAHTVQLVQRTVEGLGSDAIRWRSVDVVEELDHAVGVGVLATPSIAIDGRLVFTSPPSEKTLRHVIDQFMESN